jgi:hypothetical protein
MSLLLVIPGELHLEAERNANVYVVFFRSRLGR